MKELLIFIGGLAVGFALAAIHRKPLIYRICEQSSKIRNL